MMSEVMYNDYLLQAVRCRNVCCGFGIGLYVFYYAYYCYCTEYCKINTSFIIFV